MDNSTYLTQPPIDLPAILNIPPKLIPMVTTFNQYDICLLEGGRGSAKSQSVARFILFLGEERCLRIVCGREIQNNIEESVHAILKDLIEEYDLAYDVFAHKIIHRTSGTEIKFKGFREQGNVNIKGLEGVDILWIDEAQSITKPTLDVIMPTIREENARIFFTMNRFLREDAVPEYCIGKPNCLHIKINFNENPFCPLNLKIQAEEMRIKSQRDYDHVWMGQPLAQADDHLFNFDKLHASLEVQPFGELWGRQRVLGIDFAAQGNDLCVGTILDRMSNQHWSLTERIPWDEPDTMVSVGKIVAMIGEFKPDVVVIDIGGMGKPVYDRLIEVLGEGGTPIYPFDGGTTQDVDIKHYANLRAKAYFGLKDWFEYGFLAIAEKDKEVIKELEKIKMKYRSNGSRLIQSKQDMKKELTYSPDNADSLMMAVYGAVTFLGTTANSGAQASASKVTRKSSNRQKRRR